MARTWLSIKVELVHGRGRALWPRPGRVFPAARGHSFADLADAIDTAFSRWDRSHLNLFEFSDGTRAHGPIDWEDPEPGSVDSKRARLSRLVKAEQFVYTFDMGDDRTHLCTVDAERVDPLDVLGIMLGHPLPYWGWGDIPDQYDRRWEHDDGVAELGPNPELVDLPAIHPYWGPRPT